ncbi:glycosyltransferase [Amylibacter sp.]|nr:glycosyltransferase [Amylibacter sp.]
MKVKADKILVFPALNPAKSDQDTNRTELNFEKSFPLLRRGNYFLFVGTIEPRKNLKLMVEGFINSNQTYKGNKLVIVGKAGWNADLVEFVNNSQNDNVIWLQNTNDFEKDILMKNCAAFCYFSRYEGFGLPVLEALNLGCLVLTSDVGPIREYFSKYTIQIDPNSFLSIKEVFENFEDLRHLKKELLKKYELEKSQFDFDKIIHNIYEHISNE